jgi:hypothetical protein
MIGRTNDDRAEKRRTGRQGKNRKNPTIYCYLAVKGRPTLGHIRVSQNATHGIFCRFIFGANTAPGRDARDKFGTAGRERGGYALGGPLFAWRSTPSWSRCRMLRQKVPTAADRQIQGRPKEKE